MQVTEELLDTRLHYRVGSPMLRTLPLSTARFEGFAGWFGLWAPITKVLREEHVHVNRFGAHPVRRFRETENEDDIPISVLVESDATIPGQYTRWVNAVRRIRRLLLDSGFDMAIEIIDALAATEVKPEIIKWDDREIIETWEKLQSQVIQRLQPSNWLAIDILYSLIGDPHNPTRNPTIFISASDADEDIWFLDKVPSIYDTVGTFFRVEVRQLPSLLSTLGSDDLEPYPKTTSYQDAVEMGASIGLEGQRRSATLGMGIKLQNSEGHDLGTFGLTTHHVIVHGDMTSWKVGEAYKPDHRLLKNGTLTSVSPSDSEHRKVTQFWQHQLQLFQAGDLQHDGFYRSMMRKSENKVETKRFCQEALIRNASFPVKFFQTNPSKLLGVVYASSGFRKSKNPGCSEGLDGDLDWAFNWALIRLQSPRNASNHVLADRPKLRLHHTCEVKSYKHLLPSQNYDVVKIGSGTHWTTGKVSAIPSVLNYRNCGPSSVPVGSKEDKLDGIMFAFGIRSDRDLIGFIESRDTGSVVLLNRDGNELGASAVGLAFGANDAASMAYMTPIAHVFGDIEKVTGGKIVGMRDGGMAEVDQ
ncbi:hypothetical protein PTNB73_06663 [Pyrenophora teres f. teres]|nr:hypothetical protein PTNB73_06663 [Pyrenophora teres f. teres]